MYYFGLYHWRSRLRRVGYGLLAVLAGLGAWRTRRDGRAGSGPLGVVVALLAVGWGIRTAGGTLSRLASPPPWRVERAKYEALAAILPLDTAGVVLDVGCGTGRSLVGLAPSIGADATFVGLDVFDDRIILGNGPALARRNAARAGRMAVPIRGDAAELPFADGSVDVLTACRVLHDLPRPAAESALREAHRVLAPDGTLGVLELPIPHEAGADPESYWHDLLVEAGFDVVERRRRGRYFVLAGTPA